MNHRCHAHGCTTEVPPKMFMCPSHWYSLRPVLRRAIWRTYKPGQEVTKEASASYLAVQQRCIAEVAFKPNDESAARIATGFLINSEAYRQIAIASGAADPLAGLEKP